MKGTITLHISETTPRSEIKAIRERFRSSKEYNMYKLNMVIHGEDNYEECIGNLIKTKINS